MLSGDRPTAYRMCFSFELCIPSYSGSSNCVPFWWKFFVWLTVLPLQGFEVAYSVWEILMKLRTRLPDAFHNLMSNDNFHCKTPLKNAKFDILGSEKRHFANLIGNIDWLIMTVLRAIACKIRSKKVWFLANVRYMLSPVRLSVSVMLVRPTQAVQIFGSISTAFGTLAIHWHPLKISRISSQGNPAAGGVKHKRGSQV